ncbi:MAG: hypothetical protein PX637_00475 [Microcystis sp. M53601_WE4]|jgi:hypothetical protein|nr:hypothetical protein [Microcystis sp. M53601_WE4]
MPPIEPYQVTKNPDCFALTLANQEKGILLTSDRKEFEPIIPLNICQINFIR